MKIIMNRPLFIAFEGIDGSGKSSQVRLLAEKLTADGYSVYTTFEPTNHPIGKMIREIFSHKMTADERTIAALFLADRFEHLLNDADGIVKKLSEGFIVITDRYYLSSYAYHGVHVPIDWVIASNKPCAEIRKPDINIFIDITPEESMQRIHQRKGDIERYETLENQRNVYNKYMEAIEKVKENENIIFVNGAQSIQDLSNDIYQIIRAMF